MFFLNLIKDFYSGLSSNSFFFFWIIVFIIIILFGLIGILMIKNNKLCKLLKEQNRKEKELDKKIASINDNSNYDNINNNLIDKNNNHYTANHNNIDKDNDLYKKNVLRDTSQYTSPINIVREEYNKLPDVNLREDSSNPLESMEDLNVSSDKLKETEKILSSMENASKPSEIELTDYEKKEEEEAIISYNELQKVKDKIYDTEESEETDDFLDELKKFNIDVK